MEDIGLSARNHRGTASHYEDNLGKSILMFSNQSAQNTFGFNSGAVAVTVDLMYYLDTGTRSLFCCLVDCFRCLIKQCTVF